MVSVNTESQMTACVSKTGCVMCARLKKATQSRHLLRPQKARQSLEIDSSCSQYFAWSDFCNALPSHCAVQFDFNTTTAL